MEKWTEKCVIPLGFICTAQANLDVVTQVLDDNYQFFVVIEVNSKPSEEFS